VLGLELAIKLPVRFDTAALCKDLCAAERFEFTKHPLRYHDGNWKIINLVYSGGDAQYQHPRGTFGYGDRSPAATAVLEQCPYFAEVIGSLPGRIIMARLSALHAHGRIYRHYDPRESVDFNHWRVHVPIVTDPQVLFFLGYLPRHWRAGEAWLGDFTFPHSVHNRSDRIRVHLIVDLEPSRQMLSWLPKGYLSEAAKARRATLRRWQKQWSWYHHKLAGTTNVAYREHSVRAEHSQPR
jgi:hypothetical protein